MNYFEELIECEQTQNILKVQIDILVYSWLIDHYKLWTNDLPTEDQIGYLYIGPNQAYPKDHYEYEDFCTTNWGWGWNFTNNKQAIKIQFNTVKNRWLDIDEDNEVIVTFDELLKYI